MAIKRLLIVMLLLIIVFCATYIIEFTLKDPNKPTVNNGYDNINMNDYGYAIYDGFLRCFNTTSMEVKWEYDLIGCLNADYRYYRGRIILIKVLPASFPDDPATTVPNTANTVTAVLCLDATTGKILWDQVFNGLIGKASLSDNKIQLSIFWYNNICLDAKTGGILWEQEGLASNDSHDYYRLPFYYKKSPMRRITPDFRYYSDPEINTISKKIFR